MREYGDEILRHKYDPLPEDAPRHRKKAKKRHLRSSHRHEYEDVCVDAHTAAFTHCGRQPYFHVARRCRVCGRLQNVTCKRVGWVPPDGMRRFDCEDIIELWRARELPESKEVTR